MPRQFKPPKKLVQPARELKPDRMFETRSDAWAAVGLSVDYSGRAVKRAQREAMILIPLFIAIVVVYEKRESIFGPSNTHDQRTASRPTTTCSTPSTDRWRCRCRSPSRSR